MSKFAFLQRYKHGLTLFIACIVLGVLVQNADMISSFNETWIDRDVRGNGLKGAIYFTLIGTLFVTCGAPRQVLAFLGGYAFGFTVGTLLTVLATTVGCIFTFYLTRTMLRPLLLKKFGKHASRVNDFLGTQPTRKTIVIRLLPVGSNLLTNIAAGLTSVKALPFFFGSSLGYLPQTIVFALLGKGLVIGSEWKILISVVLLLFSSYLSFSLFKMHKKARLIKTTDLSTNQPTNTEETV